MLRQLLFLGVAAHAAVLPPADEQFSMLKRDLSQAAFALPMQDNNTAARNRSISYKQANFQYGPSPVGDTAFYPNGSLGTQMAQQDVMDFYNDFKPFQANVVADTKAAMKAAMAVSGS